MNATIVVTPWQHFSDTATTLESILAHTDVPYELVYVDGNSPRSVQQYLQHQAAKHGFTLLRSDRYITSSEARNMALPHVKSKYVVFVGNSTVVTAGWLRGLIACAEETGAWAVEPLYCIGDPRRPIIYSAAPDLRIIEDRGVRRLYETSPLLRTPLANARAALKRSLAGYAKFECALIRTEAIDHLRAFDEAYTWFQDARDFSLAIQQAGGSIYFEPASVVMVLDEPHIRWSDLPLYLLRWSDAWLQPSIRHFADVWNLRIDDETLQGNTRFRNMQRRKLFGPVRRMAQRCAGWRGVRAVDAAIDAFYDRILEPTVVARLERSRLG